MPLEPQEVHRKSSEEGLGSLRGCLVEGDAEQRIRERRVRRRALTISIVLQSGVLAALILVPLFFKTPRIALADYVPVPPYHHPGGPTRPDHQPPTPPRSNLDTHCIYCPPTRIPAQIFTEDPGVSSNQDPFGSGKPQGPGDDTPCLGCIDIVSQNRGPIPPPPPSTTQTNPRKRTGKAAWNCAPSSGPTAEYGPSRSLLVIHSSSNRRWKQFSNGGTNPPSSMASQSKSTPRSW